MQTTTNAGAPLPAPTPLHNERRIRRRLVSGVTAIAAVLIIALITTALFVSHSTSKGATTGNQGAASSTPTPGNQGWISIPALSNSQVQPIIAPSNPQVIYEASKDLKVLRRSDDDGAHWKNLSLPVQASQVEYPFLIINAGNAQNVFLVLAFAQSSPACSTSQAPSGRINADSGSSCQIPYYSTDGGGHWGLMRWDAQADVSGTVVPFGPIVAQGNRLYTLFFDQNQHQRLVASSDEGATWQFADEALRAQGQGLCNFTAAPTGSAIFVLAQSGYCSQPVGYLRSNALDYQARSEVAVWRTDDAGAHWALAGGFPYQNPDTQAFMAVSSAGTQPTLFAAAGQGNTYTRLVSADGGQTWQPLPTQGIPANASMLFLSRSALSDGSALALIQVGQDNAISFYAWKPGDQAWHQATPPFIGDALDPVVASSARGHDTLWVVTTTDKGNFSVLRYTLK